VYEMAGSVNVNNVSLKDQLYYTITVLLVVPEDVTLDFIGFTR